MKHPTSLAAMLFAIVASGTARAQDADPAAFRHWSLRAGPVRALFGDDAKITVGGATVPGVSVIFAAKPTLGIEPGFIFTPKVALSVRRGVPRATSRSGTGPFAAAGPLAKVTFGPLIASTAYHLTVLKAVVPYLGGGIGYTIVAKTNGMALQNLHVANAVGPVVVGGIDVPVARRVSLFVDAKKVWLDAHARFALPTPIGPVPGTVTAALDPVLLQAGIGYRF